MHAMRTVVAFEERVPWRLPAQRPGSRVATAGPAPRGVGLAAEAVVSARGQPERLARVFDRSPVPLLMVDDERWYLEANPPARLTFRLSLAEFRKLRIEDLTPPGRLAYLESLWARLVGTGCVAGPFEVKAPDGGLFDVAFYAVSDALPGRHVIAFAPLGWTEDELGLPDDDAAESSSALTPRELDLLQLAAQGRSGPQMADELVLSPATVKTHFENVYSKLGTRDRVEAVAKAMRLGLID
jgi:DNA-binding CsgD family transcriptional regulator